MLMTADPFSVHMEAVARKLWGDPNARLSSQKELRFGTHGSKSVDLDKGTFYDHEAGEGGGVLALVARETGEAGSQAVDWLRREIGAVIEDARPTKQAASKIVATYDYVDEDGELLFQVVRYDPKEFRQRRPDGDGWSWSIKGVKQVPYRLNDLIEAIAMGRTVYIVEGEKDVDALWKLGIPATCSAGGAGRWPATCTPYFQGADVVILPDNDDPGRGYRDLVAAALKGVAQVRSLDLPMLPPKGDVSDWLAGGGSAEELYAITDVLASKAAVNKPKSVFGAITWEDIDKVAIRQDFLVEDLMFCGDRGMIYGASGCGKSFLAVHMGLSIARGVDFMGKKTTKGAVLYQAGEGGKGLLKRLKAYRQENKVTDPHVPFILLPEIVDLFSETGNAQAFIEECLAWKAVLPEPLAAIFIDTFSTATPGANENASQDMSRALAAGEQLNKATGAAVFWIHHKNAAGDRERGHTSLRANIDTAMEVFRDEETDVRTMRLAKMKDGEDGLKIAFKLQPVEIGVYDSGKPITSCVVVPAEIGSQRIGKRTRLPNGQAKFLKILDDAISHRGGILPLQDRMPADTYGVEWHHFRAIYVAVSGQSRDDGAVRTALSRDGDALFNNGFIDRHDRWIWLTQKGGDYVCGAF